MNVYSHPPDDHEGIHSRLIFMGRRRPDKEQLSEYAKTHAEQSQTHKYLNLTVFYYIFFLLNLLACFTIYYGNAYGDALKYRLRL